MPSPLKSPAVAVSALLVPMTELSCIVTEDVELVTRKYIMLEIPPGLGLTTVTEAVVAVAMSEARMLAVNCELFTKVVARALPFQFTTDPDTKPVPFTVSGNAAPPGATASGTSGWLISETGFDVPVGAVFPIRKGLSAATVNATPTEQNAKASTRRRIKKADRELDFVFIGVTDHRCCASDPSFACSSGAGRE